MVGSCGGSLYQRLETEGDAPNVYDKSVAHPPKALRNQAALNCVIHSQNTETGTLQEPRVGFPRFSPAVCGSFWEFVSVSVPEPVLPITGFFFSI
jgi:hypothetical protein